MTATTVSIGPDAYVREAFATLERHAIRHLPVVEDERVVGILSDRDIREALDPLVGEPSPERVRAIMTRDPYVVLPSEPLERVVEVLRERRIGCAVVVNSGRLKGIFTTTDALALLGRTLRDGREARPRSDRAANGPTIAP